ncbi:hypothetical protein CpipJ_CPIJ001869 [Culex quinquefasciatus]|uniref:Uncharacterized protein n=1 Tax=Culex quinquefasciatus TaxID=7176 RepID=B0W4L2_CULQU|nr:hypothetical protein CpipJ_CPIJ001869 [Culex quinquefasciatus]|eukprot:XP_001843646.1 hypothetical protein CpipJ_CPIJ001869 [Culex quinquefasciatus]
MKLIVALLVTFAVACSAEYSKKQIQEVLKLGKQCMQELSIPMNDNVIERIMYNKEPTRKDMRYLYCALGKFDMLDANDNIIVDKVVDFMVDRYDEQLVRPLLAKCAKQDDPFVYERLWKFYQCFFTEKSFEL